MERLSFGQMFVHWEQKMHWSTQTRTFLTSARNSIACAGQTFTQSVHPMQESLSNAIFP